MKKLLLTAAVLGMGLTGVAAPTATTAQEMREVDWYEIHFIKWKVGKGNRAHEIIQLYEKVDEALGRNDVIDFHMWTGEFNSVVAMKMRGGPGEHAWKTNPDGDKWNAEFARQVGGEDKARELWAEFQSLILEERIEVGHIDVNE